MLDEIEAELLRCEAVLAGSGLSGEGPQRLGSGRHGNSSPSLAAPPVWQQLQPEHGLLPQEVEHNMATSASPAPRLKPRGDKPKPKSMADLLAMLEDAPAGPIEIDTALLYSPQSSVDLVDSPSASSVGGRSVRSARSPAVLKSSSGSWRGRTAGKLLPGQHHRSQGESEAGTLNQEFSLNAYRPSADGQEAGEEGLADAFGSSLQLVHELLRSPDGAQRTLDLGDGRQQQRRQQPPQQGRWGGGSTSGLLSPADSEVLHRLSQRPLSAPHQPAAMASGGTSPASSQGCAAPASTSRQQRQLGLDDVIAGGVAGSKAGFLQAVREARLQQLAQPRRELWERCARRKLEEQRQELKECTFAPQVGRAPEASRQRADLPVDERLYRQAEGKWEKLERVKEAQDSAQLAECTFAPQLNQPDKHLRREYTPIHMRVGEEQKKRSLKLAQMRVLEDLTNPHTTFSPQLNPKSLQLAAEKEERELYSPAANSMRRSKSSADVCEGEDCTFSPAINPSSQRLLEDSASVPSDFQERLRYYSQRRDMRQRQMQAEQDAQACTFRPDTGNAVEVLAFSERAGHLLETEAERCERMAKEEAARLDAKRAAKEREIYGSMDFKPQLNPRSLRMAKVSTVEELASAENVSRKVAQLRAAEEERLQRECTFRPNTAKPPVKGYGDEYEAPPQPRAKLAIAGQGFDTILERIKDYQAEKEAKAASAKEAAERKQLQECSFAPEINRQPIKAKGPVVVRGMERYLELKQLAERQKREAEERAAQVFNRNPRGPVAGCTVPQPFKLAGLVRLEQRAQAKQGEALQSALEKRMAECTFQPQTNHAKRQQMLAGILGREEDAACASL